MKTLEDGTVTTPQGFQAGAVASGLKKQKEGRRPLDLALVTAGHDCTAAGVFTQNVVAAAPVLLDRETLAANRTAIRAVLANAGNANACTGMAGEAAARGMQQNAALALHLRPEQVLILSTGVIGVPLPMPRVNAAIDAVARRLRPGHGHGDAAARAIMTTDTFPKQLAVQVELPGQGPVTIGGMAKGAGMIHPDMATMLAVLTTDAAVSAPLLQELLQSAVDLSFNRISVDGDTSTNDTVLLLANGSSGATVEAHDAGALAPFTQALTYLCTRLAQMIVRDGEGATKFVEIRVTGAPTRQGAVRVAQTIATSPLVKTALAGSDANWGRILAAAGRAGVPFAQEHTALWAGPLSPAEATTLPGDRETAGDMPPGFLQLVTRGTPTAYREAEAAAIFARDDIVLHLDLGAGSGTATVWTCDLTHGYVTINADYRS